MLVFGPDPVKTFAEGYFELAMAQDPKPKTVAIVGADAEFQRKATDGAREHVKEAGLKIVYDRAYPPNTVDFTPIIRVLAGGQPDIVYRRLVPVQTRSGWCAPCSELGLETKMFGGGMAGLAAAAIKEQLGPAAERHRHIEI